MSSSSEEREKKGKGEVMQLDKNKKEIVSYSSLEDLKQAEKEEYIEHSNRSANKLKKISLNKSVKIIKTIPQKAKLHYFSKEYGKKRLTHEKKYHPIKPFRGEIYNAEITENIGSELCGNHLVLVVSNSSTNIFADKINVLPIEGDGNKVPHYLAKLTNEDMKTGHLDKDPSRVIIPDVLTIDKSRLGMKIGRVDDEKIKEINIKLKKQLSL